MTDQPTPDDKEFENDLKRYFNVTTGAELPGGVQRADAGKYSGAKPRAARRLLSGVGVVLVGAVAVGAVVTLRGVGTHSTPSLAPTPAISAGAAIAYDPAIKKVVLFGGTSNGQDVSDTWTWDGTAWTELSPATSPPARSGAAMAWDPASQLLVMTGGSSSSSHTTSTTCSSGSGAVPPLLPPLLPPGGAVSGSGSASGSVSGQVSTGPVVISGSGGTSSVSVASGGASSQSGTVSISGTTAVSGSGVVTSKGLNGSCTTTGASTLGDTWTFDGTNWHQEHPATKPSDSFGRVLMATDNTTQSLLLVAQSFAPAELTANTSACPLPVPAAKTASPVTCGSFASPTNKVYVWRNGNWVASGDLAGNITTLTTDPSTGDVTAILSPEIAFACSAISAPSRSASNNIAVAPCPAAAAVGGAAAPTSKLLEWSAGTWKAVGATGAPTAPISLASADSAGGYLLVVTASGETWSFTHNVWTKLSSSGPAIGALGSAVLADDPSSSNPATGQVLMFVSAPGLVAPAANGSAALITVQPQGATSVATWVWSASWKQVSGGAWPTPSGTIPPPVSCPAVPPATGNVAPASPPAGAVNVCSGGPVIAVQPNITP